LLTRLLYETNLVNPSLAEKVIKDACGIIGTDIRADISSAEIATQVHQRTYEILGTDDPYRTVKKTAMDVGLQLRSKAEAIIQQSDDKLHAAVLCSIVGNVLDFGIEGGVSTPEELFTKFDQIYDQGLGRDDISKISKYLHDGSTILFFTDNCGEIVFDKLLCEELKKYGVKIILVVKGEPVLSDATRSDAEQITMSEVVDEIITSGRYAVGIDIKIIPMDLEKYLNDADLIISKGMANFEALSETNFKPILYLLRTKCAPVANAINELKDINVAKLFE
jgi:uncharacterized protein with ATP-grasp and redox domains